MGGKKGKNRKIEKHFEGGVPFVRDGDDSLQMLSPWGKEKERRV